MTLILSVSIIAFASGWIINGLIWSKYSRELADNYNEICDLWADRCRKLSYQRSILLKSGRLFIDWFLKYGSHLATCDLVIRQVYDEACSAVAACEVSDESLWHLPR